jgi:iron complex transport system substrate-binding protein
VSNFIRFGYFFIFLLHLSAGIAEADIQRVVSLAPVITEMLVELDLSDIIVGKTSYCKVPGRGKNIPDIGGYLDTSIEKVLSRKPDLVLGMKGASKTPEKLRGLGLKVRELSNESIRDIEESMELLGEIFDKETSVRRIMNEAQNEIRVLKEEIESILPGNKAFLLLLDEGGTFRKRFYAASQSSFYGDLLGTLGLKNALTSDLLYAPIGIEGIIHLDPDILFILREKKDPERESALKRSFPDKNIIWIYGTSAQLPGVRYHKIGRLFVQRIKETAGEHLR